MRHSLLLPLTLLVLPTLTAGATPSLVEWVAGAQDPSPAAAGALLSDPSGMLRLQWRPAGTGPWAGSCSAWVARADGKALTGQGEGDGLMQASVALSAYHGGLRLQVTLTPTRDCAAPTDVVLTCPFDPSAWQRLIIPKLPYLQTAPGERTMLRFAADASDVMSYEETPQSSFYPFGVLEDECSFVLWGAPDVGRYAVLSPNAHGPGVPSFSLRPATLTTGKPLQFDLVLKRFDKPQCRYRDVLRWYLRSCFSSSPLVGNLFPWDGKLRARPFPAGNCGHGLGRISDPQLTEDRFLEVMRGRRVGAIWFQGWGPWDESYRTEGSWLTEWFMPLSAEKVRDEIAWDRRNGLFPLLYCRQFVAEQGLGDHPEWSARDQYGNRMAWGDYPVPETAQAELGFKVLQQSCADFGNPAYLDWYRERLKACLDFYQPGGIAWDMGWGAGPTWSYSQGDPRVMNGDGMFRAQADLNDWMRQRYPWMRSISNEAIGTPSQMVSDAILIEGGFGSGKTELDYEAARALGTNVVSFEYPHLYANALRPLPTSRARFLHLRYRAQGVDTKVDRYVVYPSQEVVGKEGPALGCSDLIADGEWHERVVDMATLPMIEELRGMAWGLQAAEEEAHLWVERLWFSETPDGPALALENGAFPAQIAQADAAAFEPRPGWCWNAAAESSVTRDQGCLRFTVRGAGKSMSWSYFPASGALAQEYLKVVSLGASLGAGLRDAWPTLNAFSAQTMALLPLVESHDLCVSPDRPGLNASAWGYQGRLMVAAHNGDSGRRQITVMLAPEALARCGARVGKESGGWVMDRGALPVRPAPAAALGKEGLTLRVVLEPGEALLWGSWDWE